MSQETVALSVYGGDVLAFDRWTFDLGLRVRLAALAQPAVTRTGQRPRPGDSAGARVSGRRLSRVDRLCRRAWASPCARPAGRSLRASYARYPWQLGSNIADVRECGGDGHDSVSLRRRNGDHLAQAAELLGPTGSVTNVNPANPAAPYAPNRVDPDLDVTRTARVRRRRRAGGHSRFLAGGECRAQRPRQHDLVAFIGLTRDDFVEYRTAGTATAAVRHAGLSAGARA